MMQEEDGGVVISGHTTMKPLAYLETTHAQTLLQ